MLAMIWMRWMHWILPRGRIGRGLWWGGMIAVGLANIGARRGLEALFDDRFQFTLPGMVVLVAAQLVVLWAAGALAALRFQDRDVDAAPRVLPVLALNLAKLVLDLLWITGDPEAPNMLDNAFRVAFVLIMLWLAYELGVRAGTPGPNRFGPGRRVAAAPAQSPEGPA